MPEVVNTKQNYSLPLTFIFQNCMLSRRKTLKLVVYITSDFVSTKFGGHSRFPH